MSRARQIVKLYMFLSFQEENLHGSMITIFEFFFHNSNYQFFYLSLF